MNERERRERRERRLVRRSRSPVSAGCSRLGEVGELTIECTRNLLSQGSSVHQSAFSGLARGSLRMTNDKSQMTNSLQLICHLSFRASLGRALKGFHLTLKAKGSS